ncbi:TPA: ABC transporter ATP-binding protein [Streptococcus suis]
MLVVKIDQFSYGKKLIFKDIHMEVPSSKIIGLVAPNGTGKSTLVRIISGHITGSGIEVNYHGKSYQKDKQYMRQQIVKMPDQADLYDELTGLQHLEFYAAMWGVDVTYPQEIVTVLNMGTYIHKKVGTYSLGMRQRLCFALVVVTQASYMLLDEVMNGLDPDNVEMISSLLKDLRAQGKTMLIASHLLDNLDSIADSIYFIKDGHFSVVYHPQEQALETVLLSFSSKNVVQEFLALNPHFTCVNNEECQATIQLDELGGSLSDFLDWASRNLDDVKEIKVGRKGSYLIYKELYGTEEEGG